VLRILDNGLIHTYIHFFFYKYIHIIHRNTQTQYKQTCSCTQMFALCGNRTRFLWRSRRVFTPLRHIGRRTIDGIPLYTTNSTRWLYCTCTIGGIPLLIWLHRRHSVWVRVAGQVPLKKNHVLFSSHTSHTLF
jgi:hypothetical protein